MHASYRGKSRCKKRPAVEKVETTAGYVQVTDAFRDHSGKDFL